MWPCSPSGQVLDGRYEIAERIGPGRLGSEVFRGVHRALGHPVAIRILRRTTQPNWDGVRARFLREAKTLQIAHPSIIQVRDYAEEPDAVYVVTDFIEGSSLREPTAVLAYEMATGTLPYDAVSMQELLGAMLRGAPADPRTLQPSLPEATAAAFLVALKPAPGDRFASAKDFAAAV